MANYTRNSIIYIQNLNNQQRVSNAISFSMAWRRHHSPQSTFPIVDLRSQQNGTIWPHTSNEFPHHNLHGLSGHFGQTYRHQTLTCHNRFNNMWWYNAWMILVETENTGFSLIYRKIDKGQHSRWFLKISWHAKNIPSPTKEMGILRNGGQFRESRYRNYPYNVWYTRTIN